MAVKLRLECWEDDSVCKHLIRKHKDLSSSTQKQLLVPDLKESLCLQSQCSSWGMRGRVRRVPGSSWASWSGICSREKQSKISKLVQTRWKARWKTTHSCLLISRHTLCAVHMPISTPTNTRVCTYIQTHGKTQMKTKVGTDWEKEGGELEGRNSRHGKGSGGGKQMGIKHMAHIPGGIMMRPIACMLT